jgi:hypothetical protein
MTFIPKTKSKNISQVTVDVPAGELFSNVKKEEMMTKLSQGGDFPFKKDVDDVFSVSRPVILGMFDLKFERSDEALFDSLWMQRYFETVQMEKIWSKMLNSTVDSISDDTQSVFSRSEIDTHKNIRRAILSGETQEDTISQFSSILKKQQKHKDLIWILLENIMSMKNSLPQSLQKSMDVFGDITFITEQTQAINTTLEVIIKNNATLSKFNKFFNCLHSLTQLFYDGVSMPDLLSSSNEIVAAYDCIYNSADNQWDQSEFVNTLYVELGETIHSSIPSTEELSGELLASIVNVVAEKVITLNFDGTNLIDAKDIISEVSDDIVIANADEAIEYIHTLFLSFSLWAQLIKNKLLIEMEEIINSIDTSNNFVNTTGKKIEERIASSGFSKDFGVSEYLTFGMRHMLFNLFFKEKSSSDVGIKTFLRFANLCCVDVNDNVEVKSEVASIVDSGSGPNKIIAVAIPVKTFKLLIEGKYNNNVSKLYSEIYSDLYLNINSRDWTDQSPGENNVNYKLEKVIKFSPTLSMDKYNETTSSTYGKVSLYGLENPNINTGGLETYEVEKTSYMLKKYVEIMYGAVFDENMFIANNEYVNGLKYDSKRMNYVFGNDSVVSNIVDSIYQYSQTKYPSSFGVNGELIDKMLIKRILYTLVNASSNCTPLTYDLRNDILSSDNFVFPFMKILFIPVRSKSQVCEYNVSVSTEYDVQNSGVGDTGLPDNIVMDNVERFYQTFNKFQQQYSLFEDGFGSFLQNIKGAVETFQEATQPQTNSEVPFTDVVELPNTSVEDDNSEPETSDDVDNEVAVIDWVPLFGE